MARRRRRGIVLPAVLAVMVAMSALSALALFDAAQESRVAQLARDRVLAHAAALEGIPLLATPPALVALCLGPPVRIDSVERAAAMPGRVRVSWRHLGDGIVLGEVEGRGPAGSRHRYLAYLRPDSLEPWGGALHCPNASRLVPASGRWLGRHPEG